MYKLISFAILISFLYLQNSFAVDIVQCEDAAGNKSFRSYCPPDTTKVGEKKVQTKTRPGPSVTPTVYYAPKCPACDAVLRYFETNKISVNEKNIDGNADLQNELKGFVGALKIPTIVIGSKVLTGYQPAELEKALMAAGFTKQDLSEK